MNQYGTRAWNHWRQWLPHRLEQIDDPQTFFTRMGEEAADRIEHLSRDLAGPTPPGESYTDRVARLRTAQIEAQGQVMRDLLPDPETEEEETQTNQPATTEPGWMPTVVRRDDPRWEQIQREESPD